MLNPTSIVGLKRIEPNRFNSDFLAAHCCPLFWAGAYKMALACAQDSHRRSTLGLVNILRCPLGFGRR